MSRLINIPPGTYEHYKGALYNVLGIARHHADGGLGVVYHSSAPHGPERLLPSWNWRRVFGRKEIGGHSRTEWQLWLESNMPLGHLPDTQATMRQQISELLDAAFDNDGWLDPVSLRDGETATFNNRLERFRLLHPVVSNPNIEVP